MARPDTRSTSERILQVLTGFLVGAVLVYAAGLARRGFLDAILIVVMGLAYLATRSPRTVRLRWFAGGFLASGLLGLVALLLVVATGHDLFG